MSILTFLFFTSILYFAASDPVPQAIPSDTSSNQKSVDAFMTAASKVYATTFEPVVADLPDADKAYIKTVLLDAIGGYLNYVLYLIKTLSDPSANQNVTEDDVIISWQDSGPYTGVAYEQPIVSCQAPSASQNPPENPPEVIPTQA